MMVIVLLFDTSVRVQSTFQYYFCFVCAIQFTKMPTKNLSTSTDGSEDGSTQPV
jgi:hypothetical protein